jgi:dTDP-4-dehydrorhamnose reductase
MKAIVFGYKGWIGSMMVKLMEKDDNITIIKPNIRANFPSKLEELILNDKPTHIMSFIGRTHGSIGNKKYTTIDYLEQPGKLNDNVRDNLFSPIVLAILCNKYNIHLTYLGTGCIFNYDNNHPFSDDKHGFKESDIPNFIGSGYSTVKGYTDQLMKLFPDNVLNLRIRMPITSKHEPRNFITKITTYEKICSIPNSMTVLDELLPYALDMAQKSISGTFNFTNPGLISHNEILEMYKKHVDNSFKWKNFGLEDQSKILASERSNNCLDTKKIESLYPSIMTIKDSVEKLLTRFEKKNTRCV